eukprot:3036826-Lingulodinium_polyedra.AAC.1
MGAPAQKKHSRTMPCSYLPQRIAAPFSRPGTAPRQSSEGGAGRWWGRAERHCCISEPELSLREARRRAPTFSGSALGARCARGFPSPS